MVTFILILALLAAIVFSLLVLITGKGDAMSGGGSVRTSYKGKATFDDIMSRATLYLGISFMALVLLYTVLTKKAAAASGVSPMKPPVGAKPTDNTGSATNNAPITNTPAVSNNAPAGSNNSPATTPPTSNNSPATTPPASNNAPAQGITPADGNNAPKR